MDAMRGEGGAARDGGTSARWMCAAFDYLLVLVGSEVASGESPRNRDQTVLSFDKVPFNPGSFCCPKVT